MTAQKPKILVTGGAGMIGANLVYRLAGEGFEPHLLLRANGNHIRLRGLEKQIHTSEGDLADLDTVEQAVNKANPDIVFHLASTPFNPPGLAPQTHFKTNVLGTINLLESLLPFPNARIVFTGSAAVYGEGTQLGEDQAIHPGTHLGASKGCASVLLQTYARLHGTQCVELRLFMPYGPWEHPRRLVPHVILSALTNQEVKMTQGTQQRDFVYVDDVVDALLMAAKAPVPPGSVFNIGSGVGTPVHEAAKLILRLMGDPVPLCLGAVPTRSDEIMEMSADITSARNQLGWQPQTSLEDGLRKTVAWFKDNRELAQQYA